MIICGHIYLFEKNNPYIMGIYSYGTSTRAFVTFIYQKLIYYELHSICNSVYWPNRKRWPNIDEALLTQHYWFNAIEQYN